MNVNRHVCHVCQSSSVKDFPEFTRLRRVASDCRPWPQGGMLGVCLHCSVIQKVVGEAWQKEVSSIYSTYELYHQSPDGAEQVVFNQQTGNATPRSQKILQFVMDHNGFLQDGRMLDVGCGNGAMLRAFSTLAPEWKLNGVEPNLKTRDQVLSIAGVKEIYDCQVSAVPGTFDLISIIHALEHIEDPIPFLSSVRDKLTKSGKILIEVPYFPDNPFDLLIADHCTHFTVSSLQRVLTSAGLDPIAIRTDVVAKELTVLAVRGNVENSKETWPQVSNFGLECHHAVTASLQWLDEIRDQACTIAPNGHFGLFGTSISANWLFGELENAIEYFVEEDPTRIGTTYRKRSVVSPSNIPEGGNVYVVLPRFLAEQIVNRIPLVNSTFHLPPIYAGNFKESLSVF